MTAADSACSMRRMIRLDFSEATQHCDQCGRDTRHRVTKFETDDRDLSGTITRCLEHDEG